MTQRITSNPVNTAPTQRRSVEQENQTENSKPQSLASEAVRTAQAAGVAVFSDMSLDQSSRLLAKTSRVGNKLSSGSMERLQGNAAANARRVSGNIGRAAGTARVGVINVQAGVDVVRAVQTGNSADVKAAIKSTVTAAAHDVGMAAEVIVTRAPQTLSRVAAQGKAGLGLWGVPSAAMRAANDVNRALHSRNSADVAQAAESVGGAATTAAQAATDSAKAASTAVQYAASRRAAAAAIRTAEPTVSKSAARAASRAIAESVTTSAARGATQRGMTMAATKAADGALRASSPGLAGAARRTVMRSAGNAAAKAAGNTAAKTLGKAAARFAPGVNVAIAAYDSAVMVKDLRDPKASMTKKIASVVTAAGSGVAATNVPIVSQVGAGVALISGMVREFF